MKAKNLFLGSLACLAFAACSNDDDAMVNGAWADGEGRYISVSIVSPTEATRGATFEDGTGDETKIKDVKLVFLKGNTILKVVDAELTDEVVADKNEADDGDKWAGGDANNIEKISTATAYFVPGETGGEPNGLIAILNAETDYGFTADGITTKAEDLTKLRDLIEDYSLKTNNHFVMTNSVWKENETGVTAISESNFYTEEEKDVVTGLGPDTKVVKVYVERVLAKVKVAVAESFTNAGTDNSALTSTGGSLDRKIIPQILNCHLAATANTSYLLKHINTAWENDSYWNDATKFRSYWADTKFLDTKENAYGYQAYSSTVNQNVNNSPVFYCQENTSNTKTELVVTAQLWVDSDNDGKLSTTADSKLQELVYCNGFYYEDMDAYKTLIAEELSENFTVAEGTEWDWTSKFNVVKKNTVDDNAKQWEIVAVLNSDVTSLDGITKAGVAATTDDVKEVFENLTGWYWQSGKAYYHVAIQHDGTALAEGETPTDTKPGMDKGVVRNHVYQLTLNGVVGLGSPVYDPTPGDEEPIIPDTPTDTKTYVDASINVLKWRVVANQDVILGQ